jgi:hypothetical protein
MKKTASIQPEQSTQKRVYKDKMTFDHDLYCLENAELVRNISWNPKSPLWEPFDHKHFFHSYDSDGKKQTRSVPALGHFHPMIEEKTSADGLPTMRCGPAMKEVMMLDDNGQYKKTAVELPKREQHVHVVTYRSSEKLTTRKMNNVALQAQNEIANKQAQAFTSDERSALKEPTRDAE